MSRRELAQALGVHYQTVGYLERGEYNPNLHLALRISGFFEISVDAVFSTTPFPRKPESARVSGRGLPTRRAVRQRSSRTEVCNHSGLV